TAATCRARSRSPARRRSRAGAAGARPPPGPVRRLARAARRGPRHRALRRPAARRGGAVRLPRRSRASGQVAEMISVFGSVNMDLVAYVATAPGRGETVTGRAFRMTPGGKGANQAIAAARAGAPVTFIGAV